MRSILLGTNAIDGTPVRFPKKAFQTHCHAIGGTGKGKTTALITLLEQIMADPTEESAMFILDRLGGFSFDLLRWLASEYCPQHVRDRLVYLEPSREDVILGMNPLLYDTPAHGYFKVARTTDIILRAWEDVNIEAMPRLARWTFNSFWAAAQLGLTVAVCIHFLLPGSPYHDRLMRCLPDQLQSEWSELMNSRSAEVLKTLDSTRNRLKPWLESPILKCMFGSSTNRFDTERFMREKKIVLVNLAPQNRLSLQMGDAIGGMIINDVLAVARSLPLGVHYPTYCVLDEMQNYVGPDLESAIPEVRQLQIKLILAHQSFSQLERGDHDLKSMIFQCQSRLVFGVQGEDAEILAREMAGFSYNPRKIKDEFYSRRQLVAGHELRELINVSDAEGFSDQWNQSYGNSWSQKDSTSRTSGSPDVTRGRASDRGGNRGSSKGGGKSHTHSVTRNQTLVPVYDEFLELATRTYATFEEQQAIWETEIRRLKQGQALLKLVDDDTIYRLNVKRSAVGHLKLPMTTLQEDLPEVLDDIERLLEKNFASELFVSPQVIEQETQRRLEAVLNPKIVIATQNPKLPADPFI